MFCNLNRFSNAFKISVDVLVKLLKAKPQSSLQDKFCVRSRATGKTDGYSFAFWFKLTEALPTAKKERNVAKGNKTKSDSYCGHVP